MKKTDRRRKIREWWEAPTTVSLLDKNMRRLETDFVLGYLSGNDVFADFGCGGGESTVEYAKRVKSCLALEESNRLRTVAARRFKEERLANVSLVKGDVLDLMRYEGRFTAVCTQRVVINFMTWAEQKRVLANIHKSLRPGGRYIAVENTFEGFEALNRVRRGAGLDNIILHDWHNCFLHYDKFMEYISDLFVVEAERTFNLYYLLTRVFMNMFAKFEGFGATAKRDPIFDAADAAARHLHELIGNDVKIKIAKGTSFGPIQGFVLRKIT